MSEHFTTFVILGEPQNVSLLTGHAGPFGMLMGFSSPGFGMLPFQGRAGEVPSVCITHSMLGSCPYALPRQSEMADSKSG
mmetsp:Transcript_19317/g.40211  ORF Transcript_19317/g.40211 Transcript_19317/m.40211 type:complete len:80 (+) Transcript_19317:674-913(+)